jgi:hypothetical protein
MEMDNLKQMIQVLLGGIEERISVDRKANQEDLLTRMETKIDANQKKAEADKEEILARMKEDTKANQEDLLAIMDNNLAVIRSTINAFKEKMEPNPEEKEAVVEHQDIPTEDVAVMSVGEPRNRRKVWKSAAGRSGEPKKLNRGNHGSRRRLAAACRKVSRHATVTWRQRNLIRQIWTEVNCGPQSTLAAAGRRMPAVQKWHEAQNTGYRSKKITLHRKPGKDERRRINV